MQRHRIFFAAVSLALPLAFQTGQVARDFSTLPVEIGEASWFELALTDEPKLPPVTGVQQPVGPTEQRGATVDQ